MKPTRRRSWLILLFALLIGAAAAFGVNRYIQGKVQDIAARGQDERLVDVLVTKEDVPKGTVLGTQVVAVRQIPERWSHSNAIRPEQFDRIDGQRLAYPAVRGETLLWSMLEGERVPTFSSRLSRGRRALTVPVDEVNSISGMLEPGDRIDLVVSVQRDRQTYLLTLLQNVRVLATGMRAAVEAPSDGRQRSYTTVTLDASPDEAQRVLAAREVGKLAALLRAPGDAEVVPGGARDPFALLGFGRPAAAQHEVPVLYGGANARLDAPLALPAAPAPAATATGRTPRPPGRLPLDSAKDRLP